MVLKNYNIYFGNKIRIFYTQKEENILKETERNFEDAKNEICKYFDVNIELPVFNLFIAENRGAYDFFVQNYTTIPTSKDRLAQPQLIDLYILSPNAYNADSNYDYAPGYYDKDEYKRLIKHEFIHMFEEYLSPKGSMEVRPLWWGEGLAVYLSEQYKEEGIFMKYLDEEVKREIPTFEEIVGRKAYIFGWTIIKFLEEKYGKKLLMRIIKENNSEDILSSVSISKEKFYDEWKVYLKKNIIKNSV